MFDDARRLRANMTEAEHVLWRELRNRRLGVSFRRQEPVSGYIVDFYCARLQLAVEVDGPVHRERRTDDAARDLRLAGINVQVLRFSNGDVIDDLHTVVASLREAIARRE